MRIFEPNGLKKALKELESDLVIRTAKKTAARRNRSLKESVTAVSPSQFMSPESLRSTVPVTG